MKKIRKGFTLIELMVVVIIIGILASMSMPYYAKTVETSKATDAVAIGHLLGSAYRMFQIDNPGATLSGSMDNNCNNGASCSTGDSSACRLVRCKYVAQQDWTNSSYVYSVGNSCSGNAACVDRINTGSQYDNWGYDFNMSGGCSPRSASPYPTPDCPKF